MEGLQGSSIVLSSLASTCSPETSSSYRNVNESVMCGFRPGVCGNRVASSTFSLSSPLIWFPGSLTCLHGGYSGIALAGK